MKAAKVQFSSLPPKEAQADSEPAINILIVDDEAMAADTLSFTCSSADELRSSKIFTAATIDETLSILSKENIHVLLLDKDLSTDKNQKPINGIRYIGLFKSKPDVFYNGSNRSEKT